MNNLDERVQVTVTGCIVGLQKLHDGRVKYEVIGNNKEHCFVYAENLITIHKEELDAATNVN